MDISFRLEDRRFNYRVSAMLLSGTRILAMHDERSPYFYLPGGRVRLGETAEQAVVREIEEELGVTLKIARCGSIRHFSPRMWTASGITSCVFIF